MRPGDVIAHGFEIQRLAREGGMGAVYLALDHERDEPVALKPTTPEGELGVQRFTREAEARSFATSRTVSPTTASFPGDEWLDCEDLATHLERGGLAPAESIELVRRAALVLGAAHVRGRYQVTYPTVRASNGSISEKPNR